MNSRMRDHAIELAINNWAVGPLCMRDRKTGKVVGRHGKDPVGHLVPHGVLDFTCDVETVIRWWSQGPWNIGARVPESSADTQALPVGAR